MRNDFSIYAVFVMIALIILTAGCSSGTQSLQTTKNTNTGANAQENTDAVNTSSSAATGDVKEIQMVAKQFEFIPSTITVKKGDTVRLIVTSTDVAHGIAIPEFGVSQNLPPNEPKTIEFVADKTGEFSYICNVYCGSDHKAMRGTLIVTE